MRFDLFVEFPELHTPTHYSYIILQHSYHKGNFSSVNEYEFNYSFGYEFMAHGYEFILVWIVVGMNVVSRATEGWAS